MSNPGDISTAVRALPAIAALGELWQQRPEESAAEYKDFLTWLNLGDKRGAPPTRCQLVATTNEWAVRALAYERASALAASDSKGTPEHQIVSNLTRMVQIEVKKLLDQSAGTQQPVVPLKDLISAMNLIQSLADESRKAQSGAADIKNLTEEQLRVVLQGQRILQNLKK